jgi:hypothetical protein
MSPHAHEKVEFADWNYSVDSLSDGGHCSGDVDHLRIDESNSKDCFGNVSSQVTTYVFSQFVQSHQSNLMRFDIHEGRLPISLQFQSKSNRNQPLHADEPRQTSHQLEHNHLQGNSPRSLDGDDMGGDGGMEMRTGVWGEGRERDWRR